MSNRGKWLSGSLAVLLLAGLSVFYGRIFFSGWVRQAMPKRFSSGKGIITIVSATGGPSGALTQAELNTKKHLEELLQSGEATHRIVYDGGKMMTGRLVEEHPDYVVFSQKYGDSGKMSVQLPRSRIVRIETCMNRSPEISHRDIRFDMEFPEKQFYKSPPYTIITEESFFAVEHIVKQLQDLHGQITELFTPLISSSMRRADIQLLIFSDFREYEFFHNRYASGLKGSSGFYSHRMDRMVMYHQRDADWVKDGKTRIAAVEKKYEGKLKTAQSRESFERWKNSARGQLRADADKATDRVIRHEGAHQLLFTLGVQNSFQNGRDWITEGLATYCETTKPGQLNTSRIEELKTASANGKLIPLRTLMTIPFNANSLAYAEAWSLTYMLMQPEYRSGFFAWLDWLRRNPRTSAGDSEEELCRFLFLQPAELESRWMATVVRLTRK